jgi:hypothetical protein
MGFRQSWAATCLAVGCTIPALEHDPHAVAPRYERWEAVVSAPAESVYDLALQAVVEAGYTLAVASREAGVVTTNVRTVHASRGFDATSYDARVTVAVLRLGADSTRVSVTGATCVEEACAVITARRGGPAGAWQFVRQLGEAILARLDGAATPGATGRRLPQHRYAR